jgi:peptide/nickel transport system substrate-binding protein
MNFRLKWLGSFASCMVLVIVVAAPATATGQGTRTDRANRLILASNTSPRFIRCPKRNSLAGTARIVDALQATSMATFNPYQTQYYPPGLFESYFVYDNHLKLVPQMAREVPTLTNHGIRDGGKTIIIHLKPNLHWSNGTEITSADANFGWKVDSDTSTGPWCAGSCDKITRIDTPDRFTAVFHLGQVVASFFPGELPDIWPTRWPGAWNGDPHAAARTLVEDPTFNFKGPDYPTDGPYQVARVVENKDIVLRPMKYYRTMNCGAYISTIHDVLYPSLASQIAAAAAGKIDHWNAGPQALELLPELERHANAYRLHLGADFLLDTLLFNVDSAYNGAANPLHDARIRLALALAVDKPRLIERALGMNVKQAQDAVAWTPWINRKGLVQPFTDRRIHGQWDPIARRFLSDTGHGQALVDARKLLASTRWKNGFTMDLYAGAITHNRSAVAVLTSAWARLRVKVTATFLDPPTKLFATWAEGGPLAHGTFQAALLLARTGVEPDFLGGSMESSYVDRRHADHREGGGNYSGIDDVIIDRSFRAARRTFDRRVRSKSYAAIQREMNTHAYWMPLYFPPSIWTDSGRIHHLSSSPAGGKYWNIWNWKV